MRFTRHYYFRLSYHGGYDNLVVDNTQQVYTVTDIHTKPGENVTYADLDTRYISSANHIELNLTY